MRTDNIRIGISRTLAAWLVASLGSTSLAQDASPGDEARTAPASNSTSASSATSPSAPLASEVRDEAALFSPESQDHAAKELKQFDDQYGIPILIDTVASLSGKSIDEVALQRVRDSGRTGLYVLVAGKEKELCVMASRDVQGHIDREAREEIRDAFLVPFRNARFELGLSRGVSAIQASLAAATVASQDEAGSTFRNVGVGRELVARGHIRLSLGGAEMILAAAEDQARSMDLKVNIAVVDDGGHLVAFARMDGARPGSGYTAQTKAVAAATFRMPTGPIPPGVADPEPILNLGLVLTAMAGGGRATPLFGGVPIEVDGQVIGAVGVGGATGEQDAEIARAGIAKLVDALENASP